MFGALLQKKNITWTLAFDARAKVAGISLPMTRVSRTLKLAAFDRFTERRIVRFGVNGTAPHGAGVRIYCTSDIVNPTAFALTLNEPEFDLLAPGDDGSLVHVGSVRAPIIAMVRGNQSILFDGTLGMGVATSNTSAAAIGRLLSSSLRGSTNSPDGVLTLRGRSARGVGGAYVPWLDELMSHFELTEHVPPLPDPKPLRDVRFTDGKWIECLVDWSSLSTFDCLQNSDCLQSLDCSQSLIVCECGLFASLGCVQSINQSHDLYSYAALLGDNAGHFRQHHCRSVVFRTAAVCVCVLARTRAHAARNEVCKRDCGPARRAMDARAHSGGANPRRNDSEQRAAELQRRASSRNACGGVQRSLDEREQRRALVGRVFVGHCAARRAEQRAVRHDSAAARSRRVSRRPLAARH